MFPNCHFGVKMSSIIHIFHFTLIWKLNTNVLSNAIFRLCFLSLHSFRLFFIQHVRTSTRFVQPSPYSWRCLCTHLEDVLLHSRCPNSQVLSSNAFHSSMLPADLRNPPIKVIQFVYCSVRELLFGSVIFTSGLYSFWH